MAAPDTLDLYRRFAGGVITVGAATLVVKALAFARDILLADRLGAGDAIDAFWIGYLLPSLAINVLIGALTPALVPPIARLRAEGQHAAADQLIRALAARLALGLMVVTLVLVALGPVLMALTAAGFEADKQQLALRLHWVLMPLVLIQGMALVWGALINLGERFLLVALAPMAVPLAVVLILLFWPDAGIEMVAMAFVTGSLIEALVVIWFAARLGVPIWPGWSAPAGALREIYRQYAPLAIAALATYGMMAVDQAMAAALNRGSVAHLVYGNRLISLIISLAALPLAAVALPTLAKLASESGPRLARFFWRTGAVVVILSAIGTAVLVLISGTIVALAFERGAFTPEDTAVVTVVQQLYLLQVPFYLFGILGARMLSATGLSSRLVRIALINFTLNILFNLLFEAWIGLPGLALSTSVVQAISAVMIGLAIHAAIKDETGMIGDASLMFGPVRPGESRD